MSTSKAPGADGPLAGFVAALEELTGKIEMQEILANAAPEPCMDVFFDASKVSKYGGELVASLPRSSLAPLSRVPARTAVAVVFLLANESLTPLTPYPHPPPSCRKLGRSARRLDEVFQGF